MMYDPLYAAYAGVGAIVLLLLWTIRIEVKMRRLLQGKNGKTLEDTIVDAHKKLENLSEFQKNSLAYFSDIEKRLTRSIQAVETVRFNPFKGTGDGGNQSFSSAFVNEHGNGIVVSSLYSRDRVSIFSKPIKKFASEYELTPEEKDVLTGAKAQLK